MLRTGIFKSLVMTAIFQALSCLALLSAQEAQELDESRFVPVPPELEGFQAGVLAAFVWDHTHGVEWNNLYDDFGVFIEYHEGDFFGLSASVGITNQNKTGTSPGAGAAFQGGIGDHWYELNEGVIYAIIEPLYFHAGININRDIVDSPYALFFNTNDISVPNAAFGYKGDIFSVKSHWLGLNGPTSVLSPVTRGANYREYAIDLDIVRFGFQEMVVYHEEYLNPVYFLAPIPITFIELFYAGGLNPSQTDPDSNTIFGIFFEYDDEEIYSLLQLQMDDITTTSLLKIAWSAGIRYRSPVGDFGLYHAGATKHTYASAQYDQAPLSYRAFTYFPSNRYGTDNDPRTLWYFDNYIGYRYGENNLAFMLDYRNRFEIVDLWAALEYVVSGAKSPLNPWHGEEYTQQRTALLDGDLSHTLSLTVDLGIDVFEDVRILFQGTLGMGLNELQLNANNIFAPVEGLRLLYYLFIGAQYNYNNHDPQWRSDARIPKHYK